MAFVAPFQVSEDLGETEDGTKTPDSEDSDWVANEIGPPFVLARDQTTDVVNTDEQRVQTYKTRAAYFWADSEKEKHAGAGRVRMKTKAPATPRGNPSQGIQDAPATSK